MCAEASHSNVTFSPQISAVLAAKRREIDQKLKQEREQLKQQASAKTHMC